MPFKFTERLADGPVAAASAQIVGLATLYYGHQNLKSRALCSLIGSWFSFKFSSSFIVFSPIYSTVEFTICICI